MKQKYRDNDNNDNNRNKNNNNKEINRSILKLVVKAYLHSNEFFIFLFFFAEGTFQPETINFRIKET